MNEDDIDEVIHAISEAILDVAAREAEQEHDDVAELLRATADRLQGR